MAALAPATRSRWRCLGCLSPSRSPKPIARAILYETQWFERARFEFHPNNPDPYKVLLGRLGAEVFDPASGSGATHYRHDSGAWLATPLGSASWLYD